MFKINFQLAVRNLLKRKVSACINIIGLSISITLVIHLSIFLINELNYDRFHKNHDRIFRILTEISIPGENSRLVAINQGQLPSVVNGIVPEVEECVRIYHPVRISFDIDNKRFNNYQMICADTGFFDVFSFNLINGEPKRDLAIKGSLFISESLAVNVFSSKDVIGRTVTSRNKTYTIKGVFKDVPANSHLRFDMVTSINEVESLIKKSGLEFLTYIELKNNVDEKIALKKVYDSYDGLMKEWFKNLDIKCISRAQSLTSIWLHSSDVIYDVVHGNMSNIYIAGVLIAFVLIITIVNFINLAVIQAEDRAKEIGLRKMMGAVSGNIKGQFMGEAFLVIVISLIAALLLTKITQPIFNNLIGKQFALSVTTSMKLLFIILILCSVIGIIAGIFPSLYFSKFPVIRTFKGGSPVGRKTSRISKLLVFFQFSIVIFLISCLLVFYKQMDFMRNKDMGFRMGQVVGISDQNGEIFGSYEAIKQTLLQNPQIIDVTLAQGISEDEMSGQYAIRCGVGETKKLLVKQNRTTFDFIRTFEIKIAEGRDFDRNMQTDYKAFIINETAKKELNLPASAVGEQLVLNQDTGYVIGVVKDYHFASLHGKIEPLFITLKQPYGGKLFIRLKPGYIKEGLDLIKQVLQEVDKHYVLDYEFVDDYFDRQYKSDERINSMVFYASVLSIFIALMGLVALSSVTIAKRTKEIGIRKVFGAPVPEISGILLAGIIKWVILSNIVALPLAFIIMKKWLMNFAYRINFPFSLLLLAGIIAITIAITTILYQIIKATIQNPVNSLR
ncbi:MAG: ABC transporter permease, partial [Bacteroidetes bacterium]